MFRLSLSLVPNLHQCLHIGETPKHSYETRNMHKQCQSLKHACVWNHAFKRFSTFPRTNELIVKRINSIYWNCINQPVMTSRLTWVIAMAILSQLRLTSIQGPPGKQHHNMGCVESYRPIAVGLWCILGMCFGADTICKTKFARTSFYGYRCVTSHWTHGVIVTSL